MEIGYILKMLITLTPSLLYVYRSRFAVPVPPRKKSIIAFELLRPHVDQLDRVLYRTASTVAVGRDVNIRLFKHSYIRSDLRAENFN